MRVEVVTKTKRYTGTLIHTDPSFLFLRIPKKGILTLHWDFVEKAYRLTREGRKQMCISRYRRQETS